MGWSEGKIVGKNQSKKQYKEQKEILTKPIQFVSRPKGLGLGSVPKKEVLDLIRDGKIVDNNDLVAKAKRGYVLLGDGEDSNVINTGSEGDDSKITKFGDKVYIIGGKYKDLVGLLKFVDEDTEIAELELELNGMTVKIPVKHIRKFKAKSEMKKKFKKPKKAKKDKKPKNKNLTWIVPGIRLKIVSKKYQNGKYFLKTGSVSDILTPEIFVFITDGKMYLEDLREKHMQTLIPKLGNQVKILKGCHKGKIGILHSRSKKEN
jgi:G patch domain/KOW motif-containing protein